MKLKESFLWQPDWPHQSLILICGALLVTAVGYIHTLTGLALLTFSRPIVHFIVRILPLGARLRPYCARSSSAFPSSVRPFSGAIA